jgi:hypothetical protein
LISLCRPYSHHLGTSACTRPLILYYAASPLTAWITYHYQRTSEKRRTLTHFPCPSPLLSRTPDGRYCIFTPHPCLNPRTRPCASNSSQAKKSPRRTSDSTPDGEENRSLRPSHSERFSSTIQMSSREEKKVVSQKVFARKMLKSTSAIALAMTGSMAGCGASACHGNIAAGSCSPQLCYVVTCRIYWPPRRQDASTITDAQRIVAVHGVYDRLTITLVVRVAYYTFALNKHTRFALFNVQASIATISSSVRRSLISCLGWWRVEAEHGTRCLFLRSTDWCR